MPTCKIFLLFDSVHIFKCIRNNWINLKNYRKTLTFPEIDNLGNMLQASFVDLEVIHNLEMSKIPTNLESLASTLIRETECKISIKNF